MTYRVHLVPRAQLEVDRIVHFLLERSPQGARAWTGRWEQTLATLREQPLIHRAAPESTAHGETIRQLLFKTRRGRMYRALFVVRDNNVYVLHVRGPGQDLVPPDEKGATHS